MAVLAHWLKRAQGQRPTRLLHEPLGGAANGRASSQVISRTSTFVSTARTPLPHVLVDAASGACDLPAFFGPVATGERR